MTFVPTRTCPRRVVVTLPLVLAALVAALAVRAPTIHAASGPSFAPQVSYAVGNKPALLAVGDVNGDGKPDIVSANNGDGTVSVLLGKGDGSFQPQATYGISSPSVQSVTIGDLNGDGKPDLVLTGFGGAEVTVLLNQGNGTFGIPTPYNVGPSSPLPSAAAITDVTGDGIPDIVATEPGFSPPVVAVLKGNGDGTFQRPATYFPSGGQPDSIAIGDFNGDGKPDIAVANFQTATISVLLNQGGVFGPPITLPVGNNPYEVVAGDVNGDGKLDLVTANHDSGTVSVLLGNGDGSFQPQLSFAAGTNPASVVVADFNGDGKLDIAASDSANNMEDVLLGNGDGTFQPQVSFPVPNTPGSAVGADFNGDGQPDVAVAQYNGAAVSVLLDNTMSSSGTTGTVSVASGPLSASTAAQPKVTLKLNGHDQSVTYTLPIAVTDATGTGNGWNLTITSSQFAAGNGNQARTLSTNASTLTGVVSACVSGATCTNPTNAVAYPLIVPAGPTAPTPVKFFDAGANTGMGAFTVTPSIGVSIPANAYSGNYTTTITLAVVSGP